MTSAYKNIVMEPLRCARYLGLIYADIIEVLYSLTLLGMYDLLFGTFLNCPLEQIAKEP